MTQGTASVKKSFAGQTIFIGIVQYITKLRGLILLPILTRIIGTEGYGVISALTALSGVVYLILNLGTSTALTVFIPGSPPEQRRRDFWSIIQVSVISGAGVVLLLFAAYPLIQYFLLPKEVTFALFIPGILVIPLNAIQIQLRAQIINNKEGQAYTRLSMVIALFELCLAIPSAYFFKAIGILTVTVLVQLSTCLWMIRIIRRQDEFVLLSKSSLPHIKKYYTYGVSIFIAGLAATIVDSGDRLIIARLLTTSDLGVYDVGYKISTQLNGLVPLFNAMMPYIAEPMNRGDLDGARYYLRQAYKALLFVYLPAAALLSLCGYDLLSLFTTGEFLKGAAVIPFVASAIVIWQLDGIYMYNLYAQKRGQYLIISIGTGAILNIGLNFLIVPSFGITGAAAVTLLTYAVIFLIDRYFASRLLPVNLEMSFISKVILATVLMAALVFAVQFLLKDVYPVIRLAVVLPTAGAAYLAVVSGLKAFSPDESQYIWNVIKTIFLPKKSS